MVVIVQGVGPETGKHDSSTKGTKSSEDPMNPDYTKYIMPLETFQFVRDFQANIFREARARQHEDKWKETLRKLPHSWRLQMKIPKEDLTPYEEIVSLRNTIHANAEIKTGAYNLPRPSRGQDTHGLSWVAHTQAAFLAGVQPPAFSLSEIESLVETGLDYWTNKIHEWRDFPEDFVRDVEAMVKHDWGQCSILHLPPEDCHGTPMKAETANEIHINIILEELVHTAMKQLSRYAEIRRCLEQLRELGMADTGMKARQQATQPGKIRTVWQQLRTAALFAYTTTRWQARVAFAGGVGRSKVKRNLYPITVVDQDFMSTMHKLMPPEVRQIFDDITGKHGGWHRDFLGEAPLHNIDLRYDSHLEDDKGEDWFTSTLAGYCLYQSDFRWVDDQAYIKRSKLYSELEFEQAKLANMDQYDKLDPFFQRLLSEQNAATDLWNTINLLYPPDSDERDPQGLSNATHMRASEDYAAVSKKIHAAFLYSAVLMGKEHAIAEALVNRRGQEEFKLSTLLEGTLGAKSQAAETFWDLVGQAMEAAFGASWFEIMYTFEHGEAPFDDSDGDSSQSSGPVTPKQSVQPTIDAGFPITAEPLATSGHRYRAAAKLQEQIDRDCKSSKEHSGSQEEGRNAFDNKATVYVQEAVSESESASYSVNGKQMKLIKRLFDHQGERGGMVRWFDLDKLMKRLGFRVETKSGSVVTWIPPKGLGQPMNVHRPHPDCAVGPKHVGVLAKRLKAKYGWSVNSFKRSAAVTLCGCLGAGHNDDTDEKEKV